MARLVKVVRSVRAPALWASIDAAKARDRAEELAWLLHPKQPQRADEPTFMARTRPRGV